MKKGNRVISNSEIKNEKLIIYKNEAVKFWIPFLIYTSSFRFL